MVSTRKLRKRPGRYQLHAYVCGSACVRASDVDGTVTFMQVFLKRPTGCRYAIVSEWDVADSCERVLVWDLDDTRMRTGGSRVYPPPPMRVFDDVDQAIMATVMLYEQ